MTSQPVSINTSLKLSLGVPQQSSTEAKRMRVNNVTTHGRTYPKTESGIHFRWISVERCWLQRMRQFKASRSIDHKQSLVRFLSTMEFSCGLPTSPRLQSGHRHSNEVLVLSALALPYFQPRILLEGLRNQIGSVENPNFSTHGEIFRANLCPTMAEA